MKLISDKQSFAVFGSTGMVGSAICRALKKNNYLRILSPDRNDLDLINCNLVEDWFKSFKPDVVILAAARVGGIYANEKYPAQFILDNLKIQNNVIESAWKNNAKKLLFLGSSCIYPKFAKQPIREEELLKGSLEPTNQWYAMAKIAGIKLCEALYKEYKFNAISLMPTNLYGPGDNYHHLNSHVLPSLIRRFYEAKSNRIDKVNCWGTGSPLREFLHVEDLADACIFALERWDLNSEQSPLDETGNKLPFLNVGTGKDISIKELANLIAEIIGYKGSILWDEFKKDGTPRKQLDVTRLNNMGWHPKINFKIGLEETIKNYEKDNDI